MLSCFYSHLLSTGRPISSFICVFLFECTCCNLPATITIETSFLVLQIEITGNFSLRSFEHCKEGIPLARCILHLQRALVPTSLLYSISHTSLAQVFSVFIRTSYLRHRRNFTLSSTLVDPARVSVVRAVDGQDTGLSAQPAEKNCH